MSDRTVRKDDVLENVGDSDRNALQRYRDFFVGTSGLGTLIRYELAQLFASPVPGAAGYVLRKMLLLPLLEQAGRGVQIGRGVVLRHPGKISIGARTAIDDQCVLDARGVESGAFTIGKEVLVARGTALTSKTDHGFIEIGDHCTIGKDCIFSSSGGIRLGKWVGVAGACYIGGGRYRTDRTDVPMMKQELYTEGPVVIGDDCWIGAGARILDGVTIGRGSIIGAGAVVREDIPAFTVVTPDQRLVQLSRGTETASEAHKPQDKRREREADRTAVDQASVLNSVYRAIDALNRTLPAEKRLEKSPETPLNGTLDSLDRVNLIVETEMAVEEDFGRAINLADQDAVAQGTGLFETVASFSTYVESLLER